MHYLQNKLSEIPMAQEVLPIGKQDLAMLSSEDHS
jgi:hypothetical protein